jgi:excisionase family DNA binding protein
MPNAPSLIASKDVCLRLDINRSTLTRWVAAGKLVPAYRLPSRRGAFLFNSADVDALVEAERNAPSAA